MAYGDATMIGPPAAAPTASAEPAALTPPPLDTLRKWFDADRSNLQKTRMEQLEAKKFVNGEQLTTGDKKTLRERGQPEVVTNRVRAAINGILGVLDSTATDPRGFPRTPKDEESAEVATKILRYVNDQTRFDETALDCAEDYLVEGVCAVIIEMDGKEVSNVQIEPEEFFWDMRSKRNDFKDCKRMGSAKWRYADEVEATYGKPVPAWLQGDALGINGAFDQTWEDKPNNYAAWVDKKDARVMVVEMYHEEADGWRRCVFFAGGVLEYGASPFLDGKKRPCNPIEAQTCYVDHNNVRYGLVRDMIPLQKEVNARRSRGLHIFNSRQIQERDIGSATTSADDARKEAARADGVLPPGWQVIPTGDMGAAQLGMGAEAKSELDRMAPTPAVLGRQGEQSQSGRARMVLQQAGMTELARPVGRLDDWKERVNRQMWWRARQFWDEEMYIRVTDEEDAFEFLTINEPVWETQPAMGPDGQPIEVRVMQPQLDPATGQVVNRPVPKLDPQTGQQMVKNRPADMDMDIILKSTPDSVTLQQEAYVEIMRAYGPQIPLELGIEMSPFPNKKEWLEKLKKFKEEAQKAQQQQAQAAAQIQAEQFRLQGQKTQSEVAKNTASAAKADADAGKTRLETALQIEGSMGAPTGAEPQPQAQPQGLQLPA
jgi:hypothetical protein